MHRTSIGRLDGLSTHFCLYKDICICVCTYESIGKYNWFMIWFFYYWILCFSFVCCSCWIESLFHFYKKKKHRNHITDSYYRFILQTQIQTPQKLTLSEIQVGHVIIYLPKMFSVGWTGPLWILHTTSHWLAKYFNTL